MTSTIHWDPVLPAALLLFLGLLAVSILLAIEWRRKQRFLWLRLVCQMLVVASVTGLFARPRIISNTVPGPLLILTQGFDAPAIDSLIRANRGIRIIATPDAKDFKGASRLKNIREVLSLSGDPVWIAGSGIPEYMLDYTPFDFRFLPGPIPEGISRIIPPERVVSERWSSITGTFYNPTSRSLKLRLRGPGGVEDSVTIRKENSSTFSFSFFPKVAGRMIYKLEEVDSTGNVRASQSLPLVVQDERKLDILFINDYPTFEQRYLKNFLASKGHRISIRNRVSKERYHQEFANREAQPLDRLSSGLLDNADILVIDQASFRAIPDSEKRAIRNSIESGLGLLVLVSERSKADDLLSFQPLTGVPDTIRVSLGRSGTYTLPAALVRPSGEISELMTSLNGRVVSGCRCTGSSRVGFQLLRETYQLGLQGRNEPYAAIWSPLLERLARRLQEDFTIVVRTPFPWYSNEPIDLDILSAAAIPVVDFDNMTLPVTEDANIDALWHGRVWADGTRWHTVRAGEDSTEFAFFDVPQSAWTTLRLTRQSEANSRHVAISERKNDYQVSRQGPWPAILFLVFVLCSGFLWLAPKT